MPSNSIVIPAPPQVRNVPINPAQIGLGLASISGLLSISYGKLFGLSSLATIGIAQAEINALNSRSLTSVNPYNSTADSNLDRKYSPDYDGSNTPPAGSSWGGRMSSSLTGMPVLCPITFVGASYTATNGQVITIPTITFETVLISLKGGKNIEKTDIAGRDNGSVKEYIGRKDWQIDIRAVIVANANVSDGMQTYLSEGKYPEENMEQIDFLLNANISIKVICPYLNKRGINYITIDDGYDISQVEGEWEMQRIVIPCISDNPLIIKVANSNI